MAIYARGALTSKVHGSLEGEWPNPSLNSVTLSPPHCPASFHDPITPLLSLTLNLRGSRGHANGTGQAWQVMLSPEDVTPSLEEVRLHLSWSCEHRPGT